MTSLEQALRDELGFLPGALAVMGKWEPFMRPADCLREVAARAAAALALSEALPPDAPPYLLSAEGLLRGQTRPGCVLCAEILVALGARPERIRCCAASNRTVVELRVLDRVRRELDAGGLLALTSDYHVPRARRLLRDLRPEALAVISCDDAIVRRALRSLPSPRRERLAATIAAGQRPPAARLAATLSEALGSLAALLPGIERFVADRLRGVVDAESAQVFQPSFMDAVPAPGGPQAARWHLTPRRR